jgi:pimeloyl-ACP methyl ester carboxylesterase
MKRFASHLLAAVGLLAATPAVALVLGHADGLLPVACPQAPPPGETAQCGYLTVPERHDRPGSGTLDVFVMVLDPREGAKAEAPPLLMIPGGPGSTYTIGATVPWSLTADLRRDRAVVLIDPRGAGRSRPAFDCGFGGGQDDCLRRFDEAEVDPAALTAVEMAADARTLRSALKVASWHVYGRSFGTRVAQHLIRLDPVGVRTAILDAPLDPGANLFSRDRRMAEDRSLAALLHACGRDATCDAAYPDLAMRLADLDRRLADPAAVAQNAPLRQIGEALRGHRSVASLLRQSLYPLAGDAPQPAVLDALARHADDTAPLSPDRLRAMVEAIRWRSPPIAGGVNAAAVCFEDWSPWVLRADPEAERSRRERRGYGAICGELLARSDIGIRPPPSGPAPPIPLLILTGLFDYATPTEWADRVEPANPNRRVLRLVDTGHGVYNRSACGRHAADSFVRSDGATVDDACVQAITGPRFPPAPP